MSKGVTHWYDWQMWEQAIAGSRLATVWPDIRQCVESLLREPPHGDVPRWLDALTTFREAWERNEWSAAREALGQLHPWRKGPLQFGPIHIDTEWRSDWKWERFERSGLSLSEKLVLDVGCGNGYYVMRALQAGARAVCGIDPLWLYLIQWYALQGTLPPQPGVVLPLALEDLPETEACFDVVLSWGILAHRRSPFDHLMNVHERITPGGALVLETLVLQDAPSQVLVPRDRYANMRNVWFVPDTRELLYWLERAGFADVQLIDVTPTTTAEQRSTEWMRYLSLADALDPTEPGRTVEGYPAPVRAMVVGRKRES